MLRFHQVQLTKHGVRLVFFDGEKSVELSPWDALRLRKELFPLEPALLELFRQEQTHVEEDEQTS